MILSMLFTSWYVFLFFSSKLNVVMIFYRNLFCFNSFFVVLYSLLNIATDLSNFKPDDISYHFFCVKNRQGEDNGVFSFNLFN